MAAYCRLSREDGENRISESVENQLKLIREYVDRSEDLELTEVYIDDGWSGMQFNSRPAFLRMLEDLRRGKVQGVITKDISRLGREHIETSRYMERVFPAWNVRFIAILDGVDTMTHRNEELAQFKTLFNDLYCRDISRKIRSSLDTQKRRGHYMSGFAPYGYRKDPEDRHHFLPDPAAAENVRRIFSLYLAGHSVAEIARRFNEEGIPSPTAYKRRVQGLRYCNARAEEGGGWSGSTLYGILKNRVYAGDMVQRKTEKISYKVDQCRAVPQDQQIIVENTHEPLISREMLSQAQERLNQRARCPGGKGSRALSPYSGLLVCGECGRRMHRDARRDGYRCASYHREGIRSCPGPFLARSLLDQVVSQELAEQILQGLPEAGRRRMERHLGRRCGKGPGLWKRLEQRRDLLRDLGRKMYEDYAGGVLTRQEWMEWQEDFRREREELEQRLERVRQREEEADTGEKKLSAVIWLEGLLEGKAKGEVPREVAAALLEAVIVWADGSLELRFRYASPYPSAP